VTWDIAVGFLAGVSVGLVLANAIWITVGRQ
jgi:hypothetical protein